LRTLERTLLLIYLLT